MQRGPPAPCQRKIKSNVAAEKAMVETTIQSIFMADTSDESLAINAGIVAGAYRLRITQLR